MRSSVVESLDRAWKVRGGDPYFRALEAHRVFHGPGEAAPGSALASVSVDRFKDHYWVTEWEGRSQPLAQTEWETLVGFYRAHGAGTVVAIKRPEKGIPAAPVTLLGAQLEPFTVKERELLFQIRFHDVRHPGLFLDHAPLRSWLAQNSKGHSVLNTFAYTGSLSIACGVGGASHVTTLDLSKATIEWAKENWTLNSLGPMGASFDDAARFIYGDVFEWLPRLKKKDELFDLIILDPPSFSRSKLGTFSTSKDLVKLHTLAFDLVSDGGRVITSINSAKISPRQFEKELKEAGRVSKVKLSFEEDISLPKGFPPDPKDPESNYLKGFRLKLSR